MAFVHRRQPVRLILLRVILGTYPEEASVEEPRRTSEHAVALKSIERQVLPAGLSHAGKDPSELHHVIEFLGIAPASPLLVVEVLLPARVVGSDRLKMSVGVGTDPNVLPGGRDPELLYAQQDFRILYAFPV
jgi:hypothetical protein